MLLDKLAALMRFSCFDCLYGFGLFHSLLFSIPFKDICIPGIKEALDTWGSFCP
ncbi:hypothetical protein BDZ91DRAFT_726192 [Kalaharituber pfeilii]|nr:hypothetical protein BDZ91DRAFT_726192 [Kalaharituber pfeilii]